MTFKPNSTHVSQSGRQSFGQSIHSSIHPSIHKSIGLPYLTRLAEKAEVVINVRLGGVYGFAKSCLPCSLLSCVCVNVCTTVYVCVCVAALCHANDGHLQYMLKVYRLIINQWGQTWLNSTQHLMKDMFNLHLYRIEIKYVFRKWYFYYLISVMINMCYSHLIQGT